MLSGISTGILAGYTKERKTSMFGGIIYHVLCITLKTGASKMEDLERG